MATHTMLTLDDFLALPDAPGKQEFLDGEVIVLPPAKKNHMAISLEIVEALRSAVNRKRIWVETGFHLGDRLLQPDAAVIWQDQQTYKGWFQGAPMIAIEIASPGNSAEELERKVAAYLEGGAAEVWVLYPRVGTMVVSTPERVVRVTDTYRCEPLALDIHLPTLFAAGNDSES